MSIAHSKRKPQTTSINISIVILDLVRLVESQTLTRDSKLTEPLSSASILGFTFLYGARYRLVYLLTSPDSQSNSLPLVVFFLNLLPPTKDSPRCKDNNHNL